MDFSKRPLQNCIFFLFSISLLLTFPITSHGSEVLKCNRCTNSELCEQFEDQKCKADRELPSHSHPPQNTPPSTNETSSTETKEVEIDTDSDGCMLAHSGKGEILSGCTEGPNHECIHGALGGDYHPICILFNATQLKAYNDCIKKKKCQGPLCTPQESLAFCFCNTDLCNGKTLLHKVGDTHDSSGNGIKGDMWLCALVSLWTFLLLIQLEP